MRDVHWVELKNYWALNVKGILTSPNLHNKNITVIKLQEGNVFSRVCNSIQGMGDPCTGPRPRPHPLPVQGPGPVRWTCSNLFNFASHCTEIHDHRLSENGQLAFDWNAFLLTYLFGCTDFPANFGKKTNFMDQELAIDQGQWVVCFGAS